MNWTRLRRIGKAAILAITGVLVLSEISLRIFCGDQLRLRHFPLAYAPDNRFGYTYLPSTKTELCVPGICRPVEINEAGLVGPHYRRERRPGILRVVVLGGSNGTGMWMSEGDPYPVHLERLLNAAGIPSEVYNFSVDGTGRDAENANLVDQVVPNFSPDIVLFAAEIPFMLHDVRRSVYRGYTISYSAAVPESRHQAEHAIDYIEGHRLLIGLHRISYIARAVALVYVRQSDNVKARYAKAFIERRLAEPTWPRPTSATASIARLFALRDKLAAQHCIFIFATPLSPIGSTSWGREYKAMAANGMEIFTLNFPRGNEYVGAFDSHANDKGQRIVAQHVLDLIKRLRPKLAPPN